MATLVDLTNQIQDLADSLAGANNSASDLVRTTGELVEIGPIPQTRGRLTLEQPVYQPPTIGFGRGISLQTGYIPGLDVGPTFLNYASTFLGFGNTGYYTSESRAGGG
jgi:hypothetical protein